MSTLIAEQMVDMKELQNISTPESTGVWHPVPHHTMVQSVLDQLEESNFELASDPEIGLSHQGARCFFLFNLKSTHSDFCLSIGGRNAHDKKFAMALFGGASIFICSNLQAFGQYGMKTKHTTNVLDRLPNLISKGLKEIEIDGKVNDERIEYFKDFEIKDDSRIHDYLIKSMDQKIITTSLIPKVLEDWRKPRHEEFEPRTMWSFNNCFTEVFKEYRNPEQIESRSINLTKVMDEWTLFDKKEVRASFVTEGEEIFHSDGYADNHNRRSQVKEVNPENETIKVLTKPAVEPVVIYEATEEELNEEDEAVKAIIDIEDENEGDRGVASEEELQDMFADMKKEREQAKPKKKETKKPKSKKVKTGKGLDDILSNLKKERKQKVTA